MSSKFAVVPLFVRVASVLLPVSICCCVSPLTAQEDPDAAGTGAALYAGFDGYSRTVTTKSDEAQKWFNQGLQLLYGFNHDEAIRSFGKAAELDPACAMASWGSAVAHGMHINNPEMKEEQSRLAHAAAARALAALDEETPVEMALVKAVGRRYDWPAPEDRTLLEQDYAQAMESVWHAFPDDADVGTLFAESLMNLQPWDLWTGEAAPKGRVLEILAVLERILKIAPKHPGANHLYIHAIEASPWPELGVGAAERLQSLVPGSGHLVHMPSHIFIRVGRYADALAANERAIAADEAYFSVAPKPDFYSIYFLHNIHFLSYTAMMQGRYEVAMNAARKIEQLVPEDFLREYVVVADGFMPTALHVQIRFGRWEEILNEPEPPEWRLLSRAERHFARSVALSALGRIGEAEIEIALLDHVAAGFSDEWKMGNNLASDVVRIARTMAAGELAYRKGETGRAFELLRQSVELEDRLSYDEPPGWMQPVRHALGALLLAEKRASESEQVYLEDLKRHPENPWSLLGLQQSLASQNRTAESEAMAEAVRNAWAHADVQPVASCYCHPRAR